MTVRVGAARKKRYGSFRPTAEVRANDTEMFDDARRFRDLIEH